jgi:hypothetical protein
VDFTDPDFLVCNNHERIGLKMMQKSGMASTHKAFPRACEKKINATTSQNACIGISGFPASFPHHPPKLSIRGPDIKIQSPESIVYSQQSRFI